MNRREFVQTAGTIWAALGLERPRFRCADDGAVGVLVNDVHSQLNATRVNGIARPTSIDALQGVVLACKRDRRQVSIAAGRHAMGGQQFGADTTLIDMRGFSRVLRFDRIKGEIEVEAGIEWPQLIEHLIRA